MPCDDCSRAENCPPCVHAPGGHYARRPKVCACGHSRLDHMGGADEAACEVFGCLCTQITEPKGSASSSPDERYLKCGSYGIRHAPEGYCLTGPDAAQEAAMQELTDLRQEMEAECDHTCGCGHDQQDHSTGGYCNACGDQCEDNDGHYPSECPDAASGPEAPEEPAKMRLTELGEAVFKNVQMRRPPYAVAYVLADGEQYEVALPGDATVRAHEGALVITHASAVQALIQTRPMDTP